MEELSKAIGLNPCSNGMTIEYWYSQIDNVKGLS